LRQNLEAKKPETITKALEYCIGNNSTVSVILGASSIITIKKKQNLKMMIFYW